MSSINAQQRAAPSQAALQDTERAIQRAQLVLEVPGTSLAERLAARTTIRDLTRKVAPGQRLAAFDAETAIIGAQRQGSAFDLSARAEAIGKDEAISRQQSLIDVAASKTDEALARLSSIVEKDIAARGQQKPMQIQLQLLNAEGQVTYEELIEASEGAQFPPVVKLSGVRR